jgi:hypothetical protein
MRKLAIGFVPLTLLLVLVFAGVSEAEITRKGDAPQGGPGCTGLPINGAITLADPTQTSRLFRDGIIDTCAAPGTCGVPIAGTYHYDIHSFHNHAAIPQCVLFSITTACTGTNFIYPGAYIGGFNPASICTNNVASGGSSPNPTTTMEFTVPANTDFDIVIAEVTANAGCPSYDFVLTGCPFPVELMDFEIK